MSGTPTESRLVLSRLAIPAVAVIVLGVRRGNGLLIAVGGFMLGRAAKLVPPEA